MSDTNPAVVYDSDDLDEASLSVLDHNYAETKIELPLTVPDRYAEGLACAQEFLTNSVKPSTRLFCLHIRRSCICLYIIRYLLF